MSPAATPCSRWTPRPASPIRISATDGTVDLRQNDDQVMDPNKGVIGLHAPPFVVRDTVVVGAAPTLFSKGYVRGFDVKTGKRKWIFHTIPQQGRVRLRHLDHAGPGRSQRQYGRLGADVGRSRTGSGLCRCRIAADRPARRQPHRSASVRRKPGGAGHRDGRAQVALSDDPSRHLGPRRVLRRRHLRHPAQWQDHQGHRPAHQAGLRLCAGPHHRQAGLADPGKEGRQGQCAGRMVFAHPAHSPARRRPSPSRASRKPTWWTGRPQIKARALEIASHYVLAGALHAAAAGQ